MSDIGPPASISKCKCCIDAVGGAVVAITFEMQLRLACKHENHRDRLAKEIANGLQMVRKWLSQIANGWQKKLRFACERNKEWFADGFVEAVREPFAVSFASELQLLLQTIRDLRKPFANHW